MLRVHYGDLKGVVFHPPTFFDNQYEDEWLMEPLSIEMIRDIDKSEVIAPHLIAHLS